MFMLKICAAGVSLAALTFSLPAGAVEQRDTFTLGQIVVTAPASESLTIGGSTLSSKAIFTFSRDSLDDAINLMPGVSASNGGGSRNERLIFVRGFDRFQVPLSIDGIRIYLPADNRLDFGRFLTPDIAEIQVAKGYASVLDGPGAMGGAINLVTRKPTRAIEAETRAALDLDRDGDYAGYTVFGLVGTRQDTWYAQASFARTLRNHWDLPGDFVATTTNENGGERDFSRAEDWRVNAKAGFTPNASDEYSLSYTRQKGSKNAPLHVNDTSNVSLRNWSWPYWDIESVYFLSTTALSDQATLKTRTYYSKYGNLLRSWDNRSQDSQVLPRAFNSPYADTAYGGSVALAVDLVPENRLSLAFHYRHDEHTETQTSRPDLPNSVAEPLQTSSERNFTIAVEDRLAFSAQLALTLAVSYEWRDLDRAEEFGVPLGAMGANRLFEFPLRNAQALNGQGRIDWTPAENTSAHFSISSRARFPTLFERFSSQFGTAEPNPGLKPERATNFEVGGSRRFGPVQVNAAIFYSRLTDALVSVRTSANLNRRENFGSAQYYGGEFSIDASLGENLDLGANYSYIHRDFDVGMPPVGSLIRPFRLTDVPCHKGLVWLNWHPLHGLDIVPNLEIASDRVTVTPASANGLAPVYYGTGSHILTNLRVEYAFTEHLSVGAGVHNIFDELYQLTDGFPEAGRSFFLSARARY